MPRKPSSPPAETAYADIEPEPLCVREEALQLDLFADWGHAAPKNRTNAKPFVKWAGGKGQLLSQLEANLPLEIFRQQFTYVEPFVGGGAILFFMLQRFPNIARVVVNDINPTLAEAYRVVRNRPNALIAALAVLERGYMALPDYDAQKVFYLARREDFNRRDSDAVTQTALFIFLNRTCFNGLYRENSKGGFNVPFGRYANPAICNAPLLLADSQLLNSVEMEITTGDFEATAAAIRPGENTFFYFDPPYRPLSATSSFNSYVKEDFDDEAQKRLTGFCKRISSKATLLSAA
jgi:DNA adenine methylase